MSEENFERLLEVMPKIADAVNSFNSEEVQKSAFESLVVVFGLPGTSGDPSETTKDEDDVPDLIMDGDTVISGDPGTAPRPKRAKKAAAKKKFSIVKNINFAPEGKTSLEEFATEKNPRTQDERNLLACFYLQEVLEIKGITVDHVLAVYQACKWDMPAHPDISLRKTASGQGWIDTRDSKSIEVVWAGKSQIEKMPVVQNKGK